jgi:SAM-dependent methyltransferase
MFEPSSPDPTTRFTGLAETYAQFRPSYPAHAVDFVIARCALGSSSLLVDVGCGTGIASRLFAERGVAVIGVEPNTDMRCHAARTSQADQGGQPTVTYHEGRAEATGLPSASADTVLSAQAFHWFEPASTLAEFHRILKPGGWVVLMWNERDERDPATATFGDVIRTARGAAEAESGRHARAGNALRLSRLFSSAEQVAFHNQQSLNEEGWIGRAFSASYAPREHAEREAWRERLKAAFDQVQQGGTASLRYKTSIYLAQRSEQDH